MPYLYSIVCGMLCFCNGKGAADLDFRYCITVDHLPPTFLHASGLPPSFQYLTSAVSGIYQIFNALSMLFNAVPILNFR